MLRGCPGCGGRGPAPRGQCSSATAPHAQLTTPTLVASPPQWAGPAGSHAGSGAPCGMREVHCRPLTAAMVGGCGMQRAQQQIDTTEASITMHTADIWAYRVRKICEEFTLYQCLFVTSQYTCGQDTGDPPECLNGPSQADNVQGNTHVHG